MCVKRSLLTILACAFLFGCGGGGRPAPEPVGSQDPAPDPQQPKPESQNPAPDPQAPLIGVQEPRPNMQEPLPLGGEGGATAADP